MAGRAWANRAQVYLGTVEGKLIHDARTIAHELGHVIGFAHIVTPGSGFQPRFLMGQQWVEDTDTRFDPGTEWLLATQYATGLTAGASRSQLVAAGLVPEEPGGSARPTRSGRPPTAVVTQEGDETVVLHLCGS